MTQVKKLQRRALFDALANFQQSFAIKSSIDQMQGFQVLIRAQQIRHGLCSLRINAELVYIHLDDTLPLMIDNGFAYLLQLIVPQSTPPYLYMFQRSTARYELVKKLRLLIIELVLIYNQLSYLTCWLHQFLFHLLKTLFRGLILLKRYFYFLRCRHQQVESPSFIHFDISLGVLICMHFCFMNV